ncbi:hypothetical protein GEV33_014819 [Tenebrio molitor]|uniref:Uncharacterized protein n=1 Tax=Tenebrio molitor TaxID=7067 RepID=A0A8J6H4Y8_TENMO|nr:hypothetical protein GEV33_014821 [Tenebrio molitor]KAH0807972.1 hypothetical protein GEV33_014819 [Tenebrio molitor]
MLHCRLIESGSIFQNDGANVPPLDPGGQGFTEAERQHAEMGQHILNRFLFDFQVRYCRQDKEVCCQINNLNEITAGKSSVPESAIKFPGGAGFSPGLIHVQPLNVKPDIIFAGEHGHHSSSSTSKSVRDTSSGPNSVFSSTVDYSDTKFGDDVRFASTFQGPAYLPPIAVRAQALAA